MTTTTLGRTDQRRGPLQAIALVLVFGIGMLLGLVLPLNRSRAEVATPPVTATQPRQVAVPAAPAPSITTAATAADSVATYTGTLKNLAAAVAAHDYRMVAGFSQRLAAVTTPAVVADVYARYQDLQASISTAGAQHEARLQHAFRAQLTELCAAPGFLASFPGCQPTAQ